MCVCVLLLCVYCVLLTLIFLSLCRYPNPSLSTFSLSTYIQTPPYFCHGGKVTQFKTLVAKVTKKIIEQLA